MRCRNLMKHTAPGQDYSLPLVKVGKSKLKVQPDRKQVHHSVPVTGSDSDWQRVLVINGPIQELWKTS